MYSTLKRRIKFTLFSVLFSIAVFNSAIAAKDGIEVRLKGLEARIEKLELLINAGELTKSLAGFTNLFTKKDDGEKAAKTKKQSKKNKPDSYLKIIRWQSKAGGKDILGQKIVDVFYRLENITNEEISIVDGVFEFTDKLGEKIGRIKIKRDIRLKPGKTIVLGGSYGGDSGFRSTGLSRLLSMDKAHIQTRLDLKKLMFKSGKVVGF